MTDATKLSASSLRLQRFSFRFAEQVLNSKLSLKEEIEQVLLGAISDITKLSRPAFNELLEDRFVAKGWASQPTVFDDPRSGRKDGLPQRENWYRGRIWSRLFYWHRLA
jgi:hypothetical protein